MTIAIHTLIFLVVAYIFFDFITSYAAATGTVWQRLLQTGKNSITILWQRFVILVTGLSGGLVYLADYLNAPGVSDAIKAVIQPQYVAGFVIAVAIISELARRRTL